MVSNNIAVGTTHTYELTVTYKEAGVDQSDDMNKTIKGKVQIYNLADVVDITGSIPTASQGDYVELQSVPKISQINNNNEYKITGVTPGVHTLFVKASDGTIKGQKQITINKAETPSVEGTTINVNSNTQMVNIDIPTITSTLAVDIDVYNPFESGTLANAIYANAVAGTNGTTLALTPPTKPAVEISSSWGTGRYEMEKIINFPGWEGVTYGATQEEANNGAYEVTGSNDFEKCNSAKGNFFSDVYNCNLSCWPYGYLEDCDSNGVPTIRTEIMDYEKVLSVTPDDYGDSYYFRGQVENNYLNYSGMCWRVVRVEGDGSIEIILADSTAECSHATKDKQNSAVIEVAHYGYTYDNVTNSLGQISAERKYVADYKNGTTNSDDSMKEKLEAWLISSGINQTKLKNKTWCLGDITNAYDYLTGTLLTELKNDLIYNNTRFYYKTGKRLSGRGETPNATLKCEGETFTSLIGTLTADEIVFAGATTNRSNTDYYLRDNAVTNNWWSLSLSYYNNYDPDGTFYVSNGEHLAEDYLGIDDSCGLRSVVSLKSGIEISDGNGTKNNPYVVG